jgi:glucose/arabinose dehydrogenase
MTARARAFACVVATLAASGACAARSRPATVVPADPAPRLATPPKAHIEIRVDDLPQPGLGPNADNPPRVVPRPPGAELHLPTGFSIRPFAEGGFESPRWLALAPNGDVFLADSAAGTVWILRDSTGRGVATTRFAFATGLHQPFGMAFHEDWFYVADTDAVLRFPYAPGQTEATGAPESIASLPGSGYHQHWTRNIVFSSDGTRLFVSVGSQTNDDDDPEPRASILSMRPDGSDAHLFARGLRNAVGLALGPQTHALWAAVEERDRLGDDLVPDYVTEVHEGGFYGWPFAYLGPHEDPRHRGERPDLVARTLVPDVLVQAHSAVLGLVFYEGAMFPPEYEGDAFVALHGSWNRSKRTGYKIVRIPFQAGRPRGGYDDFITGWMLDESSRDVWGRPVGLLVAKDGALLVADDGANMVWRVSCARPQK